MPPPHAWEWNHALELAFAGAETTDLPLGWGDIPEVMADFARVHPDAPDEAVLMQVRIARKVILLPNEDQRRVALAVKLFRTTLLAWDDILRQDAEALAAAARAANPPPVRPIPREDQAFAVEEGPMDELSDLGRAAQAQVRAQSQAQKA